MKLHSAVLLATVLLLIGGSAMAQSTGGDVYTGCLNNGGQIKNVAIGSSPLKPCGPNEMQISWNETGPEGPQGPPGVGDLGCSTDQIIKWDDASEQWVCSDDLALLEARIAALEDLLQDFSRVDNDIYLTGVNLHVVNGEGSTASTNSLGNVIIGYNEEDPGSPDDRTGSHMLVVGSYHSYSSYGGIVVGDNNTTSGLWSSVSGGQGNTASGKWSSVSGGYANEASGQLASVSGGGESTASGDYSSANGGWVNEASGLWSSVSGGYANEASGQLASVSGGYWNEASGDYSSISGGYNRSVGGFCDWRAGGLFEDQ